MLNARLIAFLAIVLSIGPFTTQTISGLLAQEIAPLPDGIQSVQIDGQDIDAVTAPITSNASPEISGRAQLEVATIELVVGDSDPVRFSTELNERGRFSATVPQPLADGQYPLAINGAPVGAFTVDSTAVTAPQEDGPARGRPLLDIARVVPYPVDFGDGLPGIGFLDGRFYTLDEEAIRTAAANGSDSEEGLRETRRGLVNAGWLQRYESRLAIPNAENPDVFDIQFSSFVVEYAVAEDASAAFASLRGDAPATESVTIGDESALTLLTGTTPDTGAEYQAARVMFRIGPMLGMIVYADLLGQQPDVVLLESVAQSVVARGAVVAVRESVPLGAMALQLDPAPATGRLVQRDLYDVRAATLTRLYVEDDATRESRVELFSGTTDAFSATTNGTFRGNSDDQGDRERRQDQEQPEESVQPAQPMPTSVIGIEGEGEGESDEPTPVIGVESESAAPTSVIGVEGDSVEDDSPETSSVIIIEGETPVPEPVSIATPPAAISDSGEDGPENGEEQAAAQIFMTSALYAFPGEAEAAVWLTAQRERLVAGASAGSATFMEVADAPAIGSESATFSTQRAIGAGEETASGFRFYSRVETVVAVLEIGSSADLPLNNAFRLMELQVECIEADGCPGLASLTGRFVGGVEIPERDTEEPDEPVEAGQPRETRPERQPRVREQQPEAPPVEEQPPAPVEEPTPLPVEEPTPIPIEEPTAVPVEEPTQPPVEEPTAPPVDEGTPPPVDEGTPPPVEEPTPPPATEPTPDPGAVPTPVPGEEPTPPAVEPTAPPAAEPTAPPASEPTAIPTPGPDLSGGDAPPEEDRDRRDRDRDRRGGRD